VVELRQAALAVSLPLANIVALIDEGGASDVHCVHGHGTSGGA
jgi:hypothetical protein